MNTRFLMTTSALVLGAAGIILSFFPQEITNYFSWTAINSIFLQILGALYVGFALLNWTARANLIGGIYSRPVALGNFAHFFIAGLALAKFVSKNMSLTPVWIAVIIYATFAVFFGWICFNNPVMKRKAV